MKTLIAIDPGHGMNTGGKRTPLFPDGSFMKEREFNKAVADLLQPLLERNGFDVINIAESDVDVPLATRTATANNSPIKNKFNRPADYYISIHANAYGDGGSFNDANGMGTFIYKSIPDGAKTETWAGIIQNHLVSATGLRNRGVKREDFHVIRETSMPACLVECGFMTNLEEAKLLRSDSYRRTVAEAISKGICDIFGSVSTSSATVIETLEMRTPITGQPEAAAETLAALLLSKNANPAITCSALELARLFIEEGATENIRGDIAFCQSIHETGWFRFGNQVTPEQNNYAGIGATNGGADGACFDSPRTGVRAQIQHLKAYATKEPLKNSCVDPRFSLVSRGCAPNWEDLNGRWAVPGPTYGQSIVKLFQSIPSTLETAETTAHIDIPEWQTAAFQKLIQKGIIKTPEYWEAKLDETVTIGEMFAVMANL